MYNDESEWLGRFKQGDRLRVGFDTFTASFEAVTADAAPTAQVDYLEDNGAAPSSVVAAAKLALLPGHADSFRFGTDFTIDDTFVTGLYLITFVQTVASVNRYGFAMFEVIDAGGDARGTLVSLHSYEADLGWHVVGQSTTGRVALGRQPK